MYRDRQRASAILLIFSLSFAVLIGLTPARAAQAPSTGVDLAGKAVDPIRADAGKPTVLIFIRTDCPISNRYVPTIQRLSAQYAGKAAFWLVYPDKSESSAAIEAHLHEYGYKLPALHDPQHALVKLGQAQITPEAGGLRCGRPAHVSRDESITGMWLWPMPARPHDPRT